VVLENYFLKLEAAFGPKAIPIIDLLKQNEAKNLKRFFQTFKELLLHLRLIDPPIHFKQLDPCQPEITKYDSSMMIVDGFEKEGSRCLVLLH